MGLEIGTIAALAGAATSLAGAGVGAYSAYDQNQRANDVLNQQLQQQQGLSNRAKQAYAASLDKSTPFSVGKQIDQGQSTAKALYQRLQGLQGSSANSPLPSDDESRLRVAGSLGQQNENQSRLAGYQAMLNEQSLKDQRFNDQLSPLTFQSQNMSQNLPSLLQMSGLGDQGLTALGSGLGTLGSLGLTYGATRPKNTFDFSSFLGQGQQQIPFDQMYQQSLTNGPLSTFGGF